jgi:hypothetical protein
MLIRIIFACLALLAGAHYGLTGFPGSSIASWWVGLGTGTLVQLILWLKVEVA